MRIRTRLGIAALIPALIALAICSVLWLALVQIDRGQEQVELARKVRTIVFEQTVLLQEHFLFGGERAKGQLLQRHRDKGELVAQMQSDEPEDMALIESLRQGHQELGGLYELLFESHVGSRDQIVGALLVRVQALRAASGQLENIELQRAFVLQRQVGLLTMIAVIALSLASLIVLLAVGRRLVRGIEALNAGMARVTTGDLEVQIDTSSPDELGDMARRFDQMRLSLRDSDTQLRAHAATKSAQNELNEHMQGEQSVAELGQAIVAYLCRQLEAQTGLLYFADDDGTLRRVAGHAYAPQAGQSDRFQPGEGLVGQVALTGEERLFSDLPDDYLTVASGLGSTVPRNLYLRPIRHNGHVRAVLELGALHGFAEPRTAFLDLVETGIAIALGAARGRERLAESLAQAQQLTQELQAQQEELRVANEELEEQTQQLRQSELELKSQQEELQVSNEELEEKNELLERQKREVERARQVIAVKADELSTASKYKSEFLANMSHELRTPLNSLLLLSQSLAQNKDGNLTADQVECAQVIHGSGSDLLNLINEILDLSKIEAGHMDLQLAPVRLEDLVEGLHASFDLMAHEKGLEFVVEIAADTPAEIVSDRKRLDQVLRNLLANALKFTAQGSVKVGVGRTAPGIDLTRSGQTPEQMLAIAVSDSGIGIPADKHKLIFEAFQQADGSTTRKYGGTGLGLTISRELATLLGGEIQVQSEVGQGSTFTLYVPLQTLPLAARPAAQVAGPSQAAFRPAAVTAAPVATIAPTLSATATIADDRATLGPGDNVILVIEDDPRFATILRDQCHSHGFKCLTAATGEAGLELAGHFVPIAIVLDLRLPGMDGWTVLNALKGDTRTRHIPVHVISGDDNIAESLRRGAVGHAVKPLDQTQLEGVFVKLAEMAGGQMRRVLVVEDDPVARRATIELIAGRDVGIDEAANGEAALAALRANHYDCVVLDLKLPDMDGRDVLSRLAAEGVVLPPVVVHTVADLSVEEEAALREQAQAIVIKDARSPERLLDEVSLFLHRVVSQMPEKQRQIIRNLYDSDAALRGRKVLVVDDDMRTTFAIAHLLTEHGMQPLKADNGERALRLLADNPDTAIVLMDIMMPVMDGYETMQRIRAQDAFRKLPIIALTAKAMPEDRDKCLAAGASDYLAKPVDPARLFSMMRVWLYE